MAEEGDAETFRGEGSGRHVRGQVTSTCCALCSLLFKEKPEPPVLLKHTKSAFRCGGAI